ncbi:MAG: chemotaxis response regulator protein-glutamate methylesterase [Gammaproteobacteria bacterium]|nr:chemotaxis response regulator protein-glutamate methylesterase [Gammaproteobacteria bacterium]
MRVAIVNDMMMAVESLRRVLRGSGLHDVAWIARDGAEAVNLCAKDTPELILMDLVMPVMDGVAATRTIMSDSPCPILIVTSTVSGHTAQVFEAMGAGALDAVNTPVLGSSGGGRGYDELLAKIATIGKLSRGGAQLARPAQSTALEADKLNMDSRDLIVIGSSSGGPQAVATVLAGLPMRIDVPIVVVQHVDVQFAAELAKWLDGQSPRTVRLAQAGDVPEVGSVLVAGSNDHLVFNVHGVLEYSAEPLSQVYRPSVDVFFESVDNHWCGDVVAVLLTGMGRDGAQGMLRFRQKGFYTIAQDQATSAVYGMPKAAADLDAACTILPLDEIARELARRYPRFARPCFAGAREIHA